MKNKTFSVTRFNKETEKATTGMTKQAKKNVRCLMLYRCLVYETKSNKKGN